MALGFFDGDKANASPESIRRKREIIARALTGRAPRNVGEGLNAIGDGLVAAVMGSRANAAEKAMNEQSAAAISGFFGSGTPMAAVGGAPVASGGAAPSMTRPMPAASAPADLAPLFAQKEQAYGLPSGYLARTAQIESNFNPNAKNPNSSATGLFQFINSTARQYGLDNPRDPVASTAAAARLAADNRDFLARRLGREPTAGELYLAHQQGAGGAARLLANPDAPASAVVGDAAARLNRGAGLSARAFADQWTGKFGNMPAVNLGQGATAMPLADMPAANANPAEAEATGMMVPGGGAPVAETEADTQFLESLMANQQAQPAPMVEPAPVNMGDAFSPIPMGMGPNPFVPQGAPPADMVAPQAAEAAMTPEAAPPMPPTRPMDLRPQSPFVPQSMRQPMPDPRQGSEQGGVGMYDALMPQQASQVAGGGVPASMPAQMATPQAGPVAPQQMAGPQQAQGMPGEPQQPTRLGYNRAALAQLLASNVPAEVKQMAVNEFRQQQVMELQAQERMRAEQQNRATAEALGIDPRLAGVAPVVTARAQQMFAKPESATSDQRELAQANRERQEAGLPSLRMDEYKTQKARAGASNINIDAAGQKADQKFAEQFASGDAKALGEIATAGMAARRNVSRIDRLEELIKANPTGGLAALQSRAGEFGINTKGLSEIQAAQALINSLVPEQRQPGSGPMSDADLALFKESLPRIINQPDGNRRIIGTMRGIAQYDAEGAAIVQQLREGKLNRAQAFEALQNRVNPLAEFSQPPSQTGTPAPANRAPAVGAVEGGWRFKGGNPADRNAWEKVQ